MSAKEIVLGLDLGVRSVGWALVEFDGEDPVGLKAAGVRIFEAGVEGDVERGKEESHATARRMMRLQRRQFDRRSRRARTLALILQRAGLLPKGDLRVGRGGTRRSHGWMLPCSPGTALESQRRTATESRMSFPIGCGRGRWRRSWNWTRLGACSTTWGSGGAS
jgi:hypothetical protein